MIATVAMESQPFRQKFLNPKWKMREMTVNMVIDYTRYVFSFLFVADDAFRDQA